MAASVLLHAALLWASASSSSAIIAEQCFSKVHPDLIVNASAAFLAKSTVLDAHASPSQQACLLDCCSQEGFKCNWAVYKPDKPAGSENCYLFHCERQDDCPLIPMTGVNTYNILKGLDYPSKNHLTTTTMTTTQPTATITSLSTGNTQPTTTVTSLSTTTMQPVTTMTSLSTSNTQPATTVTSLSTTTMQPVTTMTSLSTGNTQPTTITSLSSSEAQPTTMTSLSTNNTQLTTTMVSLSTTSTQHTIMKLLPTRNTQPTTTMTSLTTMTKKPAATTTQLATIMMSLFTTIKQTKTTVTSISASTSPPTTSTTQSTSTAARVVTRATQPSISSAITATSIAATIQPGTPVTTAPQTTMTTTQATEPVTAFRKPFTFSIKPLMPTTSSTPSKTTATARTLPTSTTTFTALPAATTQITTFITNPTRSFIPMQVTSKIVALTEHPATSTEMQILKSIAAKKGHITNMQTLTTGAILSKSGVQTAAAITVIKVVNATGKNHNKAARKQGTKAAEHSTSLGSATGGTALPVRLLPNPVKPSSAARPSGSPRKTGSRKPKTHIRTTVRPVTLAPKAMTVMSFAPTVKLAAESAGTRTAPRNSDKNPEHKAAGHVHPVPPSSNPAHASPPRRRNDHQGRLKSSLEVTVVVGLVILTLAIALVGRKALESFNRRQYTRLELNDLYYDV